MTECSPKSARLDRRPARWLVASALMLAAVVARAQTIDDVTVLAPGKETVARISFNANVRFLRLTPTTAADLYRLTFELVAAGETVLNQGGGEVKRVHAQGGVPELTITYSGSTGRQSKELTLQFARPLELRARQGPTQRTIDLIFPLTTEPPAAAGEDAAKPGAAAPPDTSAAPTAQPAPAPTGAALSEINQRAEALMVSAKAALAENKYEAAAGSLNQLLLLPPNSFSREAQELIGVAWESAGEASRAQVEYELYLKLFPSGEGATRVAQRLATLKAGAGSKTEAAASSSRAPTIAPKTYTGSIAQYYYGGRAKSQSLITLADGIDQSTLSKTTESSIVTSLDLGARYQGQGSETRVVVRGTGGANLLSTSNSSSSINAAYVDYKRTESGLQLRAGRQSAISGGLLGLFDGVSVAYPVADGLKVDAMGGVPANTLVTAPSQRLLAVMLEAEGILERWGGNAYLIDQTSEGITNRRSIGGELRYSDERGSFSALVDYDINFRALNAVSLQGSIQAPGQTNITLLVDVRKAPSLQLTNALISSGAASLKDLLVTRTLAEIRADATATTANARQALVSVSRPISEKWQASGDFRFSEIGALPQVGNFEATLASGAQYSLSGQLTGSNLYSARDINNFNVSLLTTPSFKGVQIAYNNLTGLRGNDLTIEPSIRLYAQRDSQSIKVLRLTPGLRATYRVSKKASVLGETIFERSTTNGPLNHETATSVFFYLGYRYELF